VPDIKKLGDNDWPIGMRPDGSLNIVAVPPGLTDEQIVEWLDTHDDVEDDDAE
jgi:hypothetical protein